MNPDNPFGDAEDMDRTIRQTRDSVAPAAGREPVPRPPSGAAVGAVFAGVGEAAAAAFAAAAANPLAGAAAPLLWLVSRLGDGIVQPDIDGLQDRIVAELRRFESAALTKGIGVETVRLARYVLCATLDDVVMSTDWGGRSDWPTRTLVSSLYNETLGGERFFDILDRLLGDPNANVDLLELMAVCIAVGFVGKYRIMAAGMQQLARLRDDLHRTLRRVRGSYERDLSGEWRGLSVSHRPPPSARNMWIVAGLALAFLVGLYVTFSITLRTQADLVIARLDALVPEKPVEPSPLPKPAPPPPPATPNPPVPTQLQRVEAALKNEVATGALQVIGADKTIVVRISGRALFASGKDRVDPAALPLLRAVAKAVAPEPGPVRVVGHADSIPMRGIGNEELSRDRAKAVLRVLSGVVLPPARLFAEGHGSADPIADNSTAVGRERNRRIEVVIRREEAAP